MRFILLNCLIAVAVSAVLLMPTTTDAQTQPRIKYHYPPTSSSDIDGKWLKDTVVCYVKRYGDTTINGETFEVAMRLFEQARSLWNASGMQLFIAPGQYADATEDVNVTRNKNMFGISGQLTRYYGGAINIGFTKPITFADSVVLFVDGNNRGKKRIFQSVHFVLDSIQWARGAFSLTPDQEPAKENPYVVTAHEMGHFMGMTHDVPDNSIMSGHLMRPFPLQLSKADKDRIKSIYFKLSAAHQNDDCVPR